MADRKKAVKPELLQAADPTFWARHVPPDRMAQGTATVSRPDRNSQSSRQRIGIRKTVPCSILVNIGSSYVLTRKTLDLSLVGAFVEMDVTGLAVGDIVDILINFDYGQRQVEHQLSAEISRVEEQGVGLKFNAYGHHAYTDLVNLLYAN